MQNNECVTGRELTKRNSTGHRTLNKMLYTDRTEPSTHYTQCLVPCTPIVLSLAHERAQKKTKPHLHTQNATQCYLKCIIYKLLLYTEEETEPNKFRNSRPGYLYTYRMERMYTYTALWVSVLSLHYARAHTETVVESVFCNGNGRWLDS